MEMVTKLLGFRTIKEHEKKLAETKAVNYQARIQIKRLENEIATLDGEHGWFLTKKVLGGRRDGDEPVE